MEERKMRERVNRDDLRVRRTDQELMAAFEGLLDQTSYDQMTVQQICQAAGIRRTTFYQHFRDKREFLDWYIQEKKQEFHVGSMETISQGSVGEVYANLARSILDFLRKNERVVRLLMNAEIDNQRMQDVLLKTCVEDFLAKLENVPELERRAGNTPLCFLAEFYVGGMINAVQCWIREGKPYSEETLIRYLRLRVERKEDTI